MRYVFSILALIAVLATLAGVKASQISTLIGAGKAMQKAGPPPEVVGTTKVESRQWEGTLNAVGTIVAAQGVALSNDAPGMVSRLHFESGALVKQGQVLVELDANVERAQLASVLARRALAETSLKRTQSLVQSGALAPAQLDTDESSFKSLTADASTLQAQIDRKIIRAPFSGRIGIREVNLGQYLAPGTRIAVLEAIKPVYVDFTLPQAQLGRLKVGMPVRVFEQAGENLLGEGKLSAIDPAIDAATRSIRLRANLANQDEKLRSGMFVKAAVVMGEKPDLVVVPATALLHASYGDSVFVIEDRPATADKPAAKVAQQKFVRVGESRGDYVAIIEGIKPGEEVVTAGAFKLRNGSSVIVNNEVKLDPSIDPRPINR
jgi:membrane fusion protein (multidrug efflux system)